MSNGEGISFDGEWGVEKLEGWGGGAKQPPMPPPDFEKPIPLNVALIRIVTTFC